MAIIFWGKYIVLIVSKYLWNFFVQIIYFLFITYSDLLFLKNYLQTVSNNSVKIYIDISSNPPSPLQKSVDFWETPFPLSVYVENGCPLFYIDSLTRHDYEVVVSQTLAFAHQGRTSNSILGYICSPSTNKMFGHGYWP